MKSRNFELETQNYKTNPFLYQKRQEINWGVKP